MELPVIPKISDGEFIRSRPVNLSFENLKTRRAVHPPGNDFARIKVVKDINGTFSKQTNTGFIFGRSWVKTPASATANFYERPIDMGLVFNSPPIVTVSCHGVDASVSDGGTVFFGSPDAQWYTTVRSVTTSGFNASIGADDDPAFNFFNNRYYFFTWIACGNIS